MESIIDKLQSAQADMDAHSENEYKDDDEYPIYLTVAEIRYLINKLS